MLGRGSRMRRLDYETTITAIPHGHTPAFDNYLEAGGLHLSTLSRLFAASAETTPIPPNVIAQYKLAEYFFETEGDVYQLLVEIPVDLGVTRIMVSHPDQSVARFWSNLYAEMDIEGLLSQIWMSVWTYGIACPYVVFDKRRRAPASVTLLDPKWIEIGHDPIGSFNARIVGEAARSVENLIQSIRSRSESIGLRVTQGMTIMPNAIALSPENLRLVRAPAMPWEPYPRPPIRRAFRRLATRQVLDEMIRATIEGYKNQLWHVTVGNREMPATPRDVQKVAAALAAANKERTGMLITQGNVDIKIHTPNMDAALATEARRDITLDIYSQLGMSFRTMVAERTASTTGAIEVDSLVFLGRIESRRRLILAWLRWFNEQYIARNQMPANRLPNVRFRKTILEVQRDLETRVLPMYAQGLLSRHRALAEADYDYDEELAAKRDEDADAYLFMPPPSFAQLVTKRDGATDQTASPRSPGAPKKNMRGV